LRPLGVVVALDRGQIRVETHLARGGEKADAVPALELAVVADPIVAVEIRIGSVLVAPSM
jgi:hypothetical protein